MQEQDLDHIREDLSYVRSAVERQEEAVPLYSRVMWAAYCLIGFVWMDFGPRGGGNFLLIGGLVCVLTDIIVRWRFGTGGGMRSRDRDLRDVAQNGAFLLAGVVIWVLMIRGHFAAGYPGYAPGQMYLVLIGYHLLSAGIRMGEARRLGWNGALLLGLSLLVGSVLLSFFPVGVWATLGVIASIVIATGFKWPKMKQQPA